MLDAATSSWVPFKSFSVDGTWEDFWYDMVVVIASIGAGIAAYFFVHGSPFKVIELDVSNLDERNDKYTYTDEEAKERYGPQEGQEFGPDVQICGCRLPKQRAVKFATLCGKKVGDVFMKLSFEEKHAIMRGTAKFPDDLMQESLSDSAFEVCARCKYTACDECFQHKKMGTCYCRDENFGIPYPASSRRKWYQKGIW